MRTQRLPQDDLNDEAQFRAHPFQKTVLAYMLERGWQVYCVKTVDAPDSQLVRRLVTVVTVSHPDGGFAGIAPNGLVFRPVKGKSKVEWNWRRMRDLVDATIPAAHVALVQKAA